MPYLENRYLKLSPHFPHGQPKNWIHAFIAKALDSCDIPVMHDPQHFASDPIYQNFVQLCSALHPQSINRLSVTALFNTLYQIDVHPTRGMQKFQEKIWQNKHRLQHIFVVDGASHLLSHYEIRSYFIFNKKLVALQFLCKKTQDDTSDSEARVFWQIDYLIQSYHLSPEMNVNFINNREFFNINHHDNSRRISSVQMVAVMKNNILETEIMGCSTDVAGMTFEYVNYIAPRYVVAELPEHKYLEQVNINDVINAQYPRLMRDGNKRLWLRDGDYAMTVSYANNESGIYFRLYDEKNRSLLQHDRHKVSVITAINPVSSRAKSLGIQMGRMDKNNQLQDGIYIRFLVTESEPVILVNIFKPNVRTSFTYRLIKRSALQQSADINEDVHRKLGSLLIQSRLIFALAFMIHHIKWEDYCFINKVEDIYTVAEQSGDDVERVVSNLPYTASTAPEETASIDDLDRLLTNAEFCPSLSQSFIALMVNNVRQYSLPQHLFTQALFAAEESSRIELTNEYAQGLDKLMAIQRNDFSQLENKYRNKLESESQRGVTQINKKCHEAYLQIVCHVLLTARDKCESHVFAEYQQLLIQLMHPHRLEVNEDLERRHMEKMVSQDLCSLGSFRSGFFGTLERKRETVIQCVSERRAMVYAAREHLSRLQQRLALQATEQQTRAAMSSRSLHVLNNLWTFNSLPVAGTYTLAQLFELGNCIRNEVEKHVQILKSTCATNYNGQSILETLFLAEEAGWDVFMGGSAARGSPWANDLDIKLSPSDDKMTDEQRLKLFLIFQDLLDSATDVRGYPEKGLMTFDIQGLSMPVNVVIYLSYQGQYQYDPLYTDDVVVRIKRERPPVAGSWLQFYRHRYDANHAESCFDTVIDVLNVAHILETQHIHARRYDPPAILRVLREIAYSPDKERVNAEPLRELIRKMRTDVSINVYQDTLHEFYEGKHKVSPAYFPAFLSLLNRYGLPERSNQLPSTPDPSSRAASYQSKPTRFGYAHLIELLVDRHKQQPDSVPRLTMLECIERVLERQSRKGSIVEFQDFAARIRGASTQPAATSHALS